MSKGQGLFSLPVSGNTVMPIDHRKLAIWLVAADGFTAVLAVGCPQCKNILKK